jgi:hypothetical protein
MSNEKLTVKKLDEMESHAIIDTGILDNKDIYENPIRWVAKRGEINDWAIYYDEATKTEKQVRQLGYKLIEKKFIEMLVPCTPKAFDKYRY